MGSGTRPGFGVYPTLFTQPEEGRLVKAVRRATPGDFGRREQLKEKKRPLSVCPVRNPGNPNLA